MVWYQVGGRDPVTGSTSRINLNSADAVKHWERVYREGGRTSVTTLDVTNQERILPDGTRVPDARAAEEARTRADEMNNGTWGRKTVEPEAKVREQGASRDTPLEERQTQVAERLAAEEGGRVR
jgi:hypothetical protein